MPTVFVRNGYRFFFFSNEQREPPHIHVERAENLAKFWITPDVVLARNTGFRTHEIAEIRRIAVENRDNILVKWYEHFSR